MKMATNKHESLQILHPLYLLDSRKVNILRLGWMNPQKLRDGMNKRKFPSQLLHDSGWSQVGSWWVPGGFWLVPGMC